MLEIDVTNCNDTHPRPPWRSNWLRPVHRWGRAGLDLLFPPNCALCYLPLTTDGPLPRLCVACQEQLQSASSKRCQRCGHLVAINVGQGSSCSKCTENRFVFDRVVVLGSYDGRLKQAILRMKHSGEHSLATAVGQIVGQRLAKEQILSKVDIVTYMPMHWLRRMKRGINSAELIAESASSELELPLRSLLRIRRKTEKQSMLTPPQRKHNVQDAFAASKRVRLSGQHVMIVDDTLTTGATANEAAKTLRSMGAGKITVVVLGRAARNW